MGAGPVPGEVLRRAGALLLALGLIAACGPPRRPPPGGAAPRLVVRDSLVPLPPDSIVHLRRELQSGFQDAARLVVRDSATWRLAWQQLIAQYPSTERWKLDRPAVDFTRYMVIVVALGFRNCGYETIAVEGVVRDVGRYRRRVLVRSRDTDPSVVWGHGCEASSVVTPADVVRVPAEPVPILFVEELVRGVPPPGTDPFR